MGLPTKDAIRYISSKFGGLVNTSNSLLCSFSKHDIACDKMSGVTLQVSGFNVADQCMLKAPCPAVCQYPYSLLTVLCRIQTHNCR